MNYITDGTFWVVVLVMAGVIWAVWYSLKKEIDKLKKEYDDRYNFLIDAVDHDQKNIIHDINLIFDKLEISHTLLKSFYDSSNKEMQKKIDKNASKIENEKKHANHNN